MHLFSSNDVKDESSEVNRAAAPAAVFALPWVTFVKAAEKASSLQKPDGLVNAVQPASHDCSASAMTQPPPACALLSDESEPPVVDSEPPVVDSEPPVVDSEPPVVDSVPPVVDSEPPVVDSVPPVVDSVPPDEVDESDDVHAPPSFSGRTWH